LLRDAAPSELRASAIFLTEVNTLLALGDSVRLVRASIEALKSAEERDDWACPRLGG